MCVCMFMWEYVQKVHSIQNSIINFICSIYQSCLKPLNCFKHFNISTSIMFIYHITNPFYEGLTEGKY